MTAVVETERLSLRVPTAADRATLGGWFGDPRIMADLAPVMDDAALDATIARHEAHRGERIGFWIVERKADGAAIGFCGLKRCNPGMPLKGELEIGWIFAPEYWGQGYAREAAAACIAWAWAHLPDRRLVALTARVNSRSQVLMGRLGMHAEPMLDYLNGGLPDDHRLSDMVVYAIDRPA